MNSKKFEMQPILRGEKVLLRPLKVADFENLYAVASDPLVWEQHPQNTRYQRPVFENFFSLAIESGGAFAICLADTGAIIGSSRFYDYDSEKNNIAIGYTFLGRGYWGGSYNREVKRLMLNHAFQFVESVLFHVGEKNIRSQRAMAKIGAVHVQTIPPEIPADGGQNVFVFEIERPITTKVLN